MYHGSGFPVAIPLYVGVSNDISSQSRKTTKGFTRFSLKLRVEPIVTERGCGFQISFSQTPTRRSVTSTLFLTHNCADSTERWVTRSKTPIKVMNQKERCIAESRMLSLPLTKEMRRRFCRLPFPSIVPLNKIPFCQIVKDINHTTMLFRLHEPLSRGIGGLLRMTHITWYATTPVRESREKFPWR